MIAYSLDAVGEAVDEAVWLLQHLKKDAVELRASAGSRVTERHRPKNTARPPNPLTGIKSPASKSTL
uniref:Uncharacterized protein n=1 Tax=Oryza rufipogon TaxID=4529 RepID=A0A0E0R2P3_ORYRU